MQSDIVEILLGNLSEYLIDDYSILIKVAYLNYHIFENTEWEIRDDELIIYSKGMKNTVLKLEQINLIGLEGDY